MWILITAVVSASLLGSMHCVGMCGPLAIWASGAGDGRSARHMAVATTLYHLGRMLTYALAGLLAGAVGQLTDMGGNALGLQLLAARVVGVSMVGIGAVRLAQLLWTGLRPKKSLDLSASQPPLLTRTLVKLRPVVFRLPLAARGLVTGLLTALLPCGWLYLFALVAAGTGSWIMGPIVMLAFWAGTVPALVALVSGTQALAIRFRRAIPAAAAVLLMVGGGYTAAGRGFANLNSFSDIQLRGTAQFASEAAAVDRTSPQEAAHITQSLEELVSTPLPCCVVETADVAQPKEAASSAGVIRP